MPRARCSRSRGKTAAARTPDPFAQEGGKIVFRRNWYQPTPLGRLRERTFVTAPITYSAYRFVTSLYGTKGYDHQ